MAGKKTLLGVENVDVRGVGGYVMAPGSLHYSGAVYTAHGRLEDITVASDDLVAHLVPHEESQSGNRQRQRITLGQDNVIGIGSARSHLTDLPAELEDLLNSDLPVKQRSEPAFLALRRLAPLIDDDLALAETILAFALGKRYYEHPLDFLLGEVERARNFPDTPEGQHAHFLAKQHKLVEEQWIASQVLATMTRKVLRGYQEISLERGGGVFPASLAEVAIAAGVEIATVQRHRDKLMDGGWLVKVWASNGGGKASTYRLHIPSDETMETTEEYRGTSVVGTPQVLGGLLEMSPSRGRRILWRVHSAAYGKPTPSGQKSAQSPTAKKSPPSEPAVDLSADSARYQTTTTLWEVLPYLTQETTPRELAEAMGRSKRQVRRITARLLAEGLIADRQYIKLVENWREVWDSLPEKMGTAGKKEAAEHRLAQDRLARRRLRLVREGKAVPMEGYVVTEDGEII
jgi:hypothetical protein